MIDSQRAHLASNTTQFALIANKQKTSQLQKKKSLMQVNRPTSITRNIGPPKVQQAVKLNQGQYAPSKSTHMSNM